jgi:anthranilate phosphoribosyltransferase
MSLRPYLQPIAEGETLSREQAEEAMRIIMRGDAEPEETAGFLVGLRSRGETVEELTGFTAIMREFAVPVELNDDEAIDLCGTGGDHAGTFNISTTAALVCAGAGVTVAKHGNRSVSSNSGSADVLESLGVVTTLDKEGVEYCLEEAGISFIFAPNFHPAMRHVMPVRRSLGVRTFFNILGPLCNPAGVKHQLIGAFSADVARAMAGILERLDSKHVVTVHADIGLDELSTIGRTTVFEVTNNGDETNTSDSAIHTRYVTPETHGIAAARPEDLEGGSAEENSEILRNVLKGHRGPQRDITVLNAGYALYTSDRYENIDAALAAARESIDSGAAFDSLEALIEVSREAAAKQA